MGPIDIRGFVTFVVVSTLVVGVVIGVGGLYGGTYLAHHLKWT